MLGRLRRLRPPVLLAAAAALIGVLDIGSAMTDEMADRLAIVRADLPAGAPSLAGGVAFAAGVAMLMLSGSLARRKRRAWSAAVVLVSVSAVAHIAKGLDVEEALANILLLGAFLHWRPWFNAPGDPGIRRPLMAVCAVWVGCAFGFTFAGGVAEDGFGILLIGLALTVVYLWFRAWGEPGEHTADEHERARGLVAAHGEDSLSFFSLRRDKRFHFSEDGRAFLAYRVVAGCALVSGDPIGEPSSIARLFDEFRTHAHARGWRLVVLHAGPEHLDVYRARGMKAVPIGDEAVLPIDRFSLDGRPIRKVRQSVTRLDREGYRALVLRADELTDEQRAEVNHVSAEWLGRWCDRGFSMAMDDLHGQPDARFVLGVDAEGRVGGFLHMVPFRHGYSLSSMRRLSYTPNGLMEFLICSAAAWGREAGVRELSLNFSVFADVLRADSDSSVLLRATRWWVLRLDGLFQLERLFSFNRKFFPEWRTRYICFERAVDVPVLSLATLRVERLLAPPRLLPRRTEA